MSDQPQHIIILGSTGSIGTQTLDVIRTHPDRLKAFALTANRNWELLAQQVLEFQPMYAILTDADKVERLKSAVSGTKTEVLCGRDALISLVTDPDATIVLNSLVGFSGFLPTYHALNSGKRVALANKESLVVGGELLKEHLSLDNPKLFPVDSEHSAILQCLVGEPEDSIRNVIITASGGPFRGYSPEQLKSVTVESALKHPNWEMGAKITIDSATLMNKGLEVMEAYWLFGLPLSKIQAVVHPQSIIHSMVTFADGSTKAQLGIPDMRVPIQYALSYPDRWPTEVPLIDWSKAHSWTFTPIDEVAFPCYRLALNSLEAAGFAPAVLNASNEVAVQRFLNKEIPYIGIPKIVEKSLENIHHQSDLNVGSIVDVDKETREYAKTLTI